METIDGVVEPEETVDAKTHALSNEVQPLTLRASDVPEIATLEQRQEAEMLLHDIKERHRGVTEIKEFFAKPVRDLARKYSSKFKPMLDALEGAERSVKRRIGDYDLAQRAKAREAERKAVLAAQAEERKREKKAEKAAAAGKHELAADLRNTPVIPVAQPPAPKVSSSTSTRSKYVARITDEDAVPRRYMAPDIKRLNDFANGYKDSVPPKVPGVMWEEKAIVTARR